MKGMKRLVGIAALAVLLTGLAAPRPAHASGTTNAIIIGAGVVGGLVAITLIGTALTRHNPAFLTDAQGRVPILRVESKRETLGFGPGCPQAGGRVLSVCW